MEIFRFHQGSTPLVVSVPHRGVHVPPEIADLDEFTAGDHVVFEYRRDDGRLTAILLRKYEEG